MTDFLSDDARPDPRDTPAEAAPSPSGLDRRSFLRALSGSALTLVAGGLTVTLSACQGGGGGGGSSPNTVNVPFSGAGPQTPISPQSSSLFFGSGSSLTGGTSSSTTSSSTTSSTTSSGSTTSSSTTSSGSSGSTGSSSSRSSSSVSGALRRAAAGVNGWSTRV